jgi:predicted nucleic acid-binding protein
MELNRYLIDPNAIINYLGGKLPDSSLVFMNEVVDSVPIVSVISKIEVLGFQASEDHSKILTNFMADALVLELSELVVDQTIDIRKKYKTKLPDAIIAATALVNGLILISSNRGDFRNISGLRVVDPFQFHTLKD